MQLVSQQSIIYLKNFHIKLKIAKAITAAEQYYRRNSRPPQPWASTVENLVLIPNFRSRHPRHFGDAAAGVSSATAAASLAISEVSIYNPQEIMQHISAVIALMSIKHLKAARSFKHSLSGNVANFDFKFWQAGLEGHFFEDSQSPKSLVSLILTPTWADSQILQILFCWSVSVS